ncbi:MAG: carboxypeptidase regulatory-like domain-containing protein [Deltaproteobacteria bacterium]|nr:carboxypeptidase regulatory-like domain-containing protein [Deltaproteobacteria bacterium]
MRTSPRSHFLIGCLVCAAAVSSSFGSLRPASAQTVEPPLAPAPVELHEPAPVLPAADVAPDAPAPQAAPEAPAPVPATAAPAKRKDEVDEIRAPAWISEDPPPVVRHEKPAAPADWVAGLAFGSGAQGTLRVLSADTGIVDQLRLHFGADVASGSSVIVRGDKNTRLGGALAASYSPTLGLELFGALLGASNKNQRICTGGVCTSEEGRVDPQVIRAFGDLLLGAKVARQVSAEWALAAYADLRFLSSSDGVFFDFGATSIDLGGAATWDLQAVHELPVRLHANLGFVVDNSTNLQDFAGVGQPSELVASYAYGLGRNRLRTALALESVPWSVAQHASLTPFIEYQLDWVTGKANQRFADFTTPGCETSGRPCQDNRDQQRLAFGVRAQINKAWVLTSALDFGFRSVGFPYGPPQAPLTFAFVVGRAFDLSGTPPQAPPVAAAPIEEAPEDGVVTGRVFNAVDNTPVGNAIVGVVGRGRSRVATDPDGTFTSHDIAPAAVQLEVAAVGFESQIVRAQVSAGMATEIDVRLVPKAEGTARGRVADVNGKGIVARVLFSGTTSVAVLCDEQGRFEAKLAAGVYIVRAELAGYLVKEQRLSLDANSTLDVNFVLRPRKEVATAEYVPPSGLVLRLPLKFETQTNGLPVVLGPKSLQILDEVVDVLVTHPRISKLVIETHWDAEKVGGKDPQLITDLQAHAIADYLQAQGVAADRLSPQPKGASHPVVPNVGKNRSKNRRVVLSALEDT